MLRFARDNRHKTQLLGDKDARERVEPFLTGETFEVYFHLIYEIEGDLRILLALVLNVIVLGTQIDGALPVAYALVVATLFLMQWLMRKRVASAYLENQRMNNRMTAQGYTAWDNVFSGNRYNLRLWIAGFKDRLRSALTAQIRAIMTKEWLERGERHHQPRHRVRGDGLDRLSPCRRHGGADRARRHAAAADRDDARRAFVHVRLERSAGAMDAAARRRRQHPSADRSRISTCA